MLVAVIGTQVRRSALSFAKETLRLKDAGMSVILSTDPEARAKEVQSFGFFGGSSDTNKFFPDIKATDLIPKPEDFVKVPFRLLSATIVGAGTWKATDFTDAKVLKASMPHLTAKPLFFDHEQDIMNWVGLIDSVKWSEGYTADDGTKVPPGIDGMLAIDAKTNPKLARGVMMGAVFSDSVTVIFDWVPSHPTMAPEQFMQKMGAVVDGKMVCRKVTAIYDYHETSLCWLGADPFAKRYDENGKLTNIDTSATFSDEPDSIRTQYEKEQTFTVSYGLDKAVCLSMTKSLLSLNSSVNPKTDTMNPKVQAMLCAMLGLAAGTEITEQSFSDGMAIVTKEQNTANTANAALASSLKEKAKVVLGKDPEDMTAFLTTHEFVAVGELPAMKAADALVTSLTAEVEGATRETILASVQALKVSAASGKKALEAKRTETERLYKIHVANKSEQSVLDLIKGATDDQLDGLLKSYTKGVTDSFKGTCTKCGATGEAITFRSSVDSNEDEPPQAVATDDSFASVYKDMSKSSMRIG